jgi:hypothetical protein
MKTKQLFSLKYYYYRKHQVLVQIDSKLQVITALIEQESKLAAGSFLASKMQSSLQATMQASGY